MTKEIWKDIPGFEGLYKVSSLGSIKSYARMTYNGQKHYLKPGKTFVLRSKSAQDYLMVTLTKDKPCNASVHRLVALTHVANPNNYKYVNHKDLNKENNAADNLEWCTNRENSNHYLQSVGFADNGICYVGNKWMVRLRLLGSRHSFGRYSTKEAAIEVRDTIIQEVESLNIESSDVKQYIRLYKERFGLDGTKWVRKSA